MPLITPLSGFCSYFVRIFLPNFCGISRLCAGTRTSSPIPSGRRVDRLAKRLDDRFQG